MIDHTGVVVSNFATSKEFYTKALGAIGLSLLKEFPASMTGGTDVAGFGASESAAQGVIPEFWLASGTPGSTPVHVAFRVASRALVQAFHKAALAGPAGGNRRPAC